MEPHGFGILYEQGPCLVVLKPAGVLTQAPWGLDSLEVRVRQFLRARDGASENFYLVVAHRLDRPVSGALVMARNVRAAQRLGQQFEHLHVKKRYWAWLEGQLDEPAGTWNDFLRKVPGQPRAELVPQEHEGAQLATLHYRVLQQAEQKTLVEIELQTGRYHQIRLQAGSRGHPAVGDVQYGSQRPFGPQHPDPRERAIALHSRQLEFQHPITDQQVAITAPLPDYWDEEGCRL